VRDWVGSKYLRTGQKHDNKEPILKIAVILSDSPGCKHDLQVVQSALAPLLNEDRDSIISISVPWAARNWRRGIVERKITIGFDPDCVFFIEVVVNHSTLLKARHRVLIPNPEYIDDAILTLAGQCNHVWHKSRLSFDRLAPTFLSAKHTLVGFTSCDPSTRVTSYTSFIHAIGNVFTHRNTSTVVQCWSARPDWPNLHVLFHGGDLNLKLSDFRPDSNIHPKSGWLEIDAYLWLAGDHGIHLCTSEVEGFGHYINEARALGALVVTTDAPPMNELVDNECGVLVKPRTTIPMNFGTRFLIDPEDFAVTVDKILQLEPRSRQRFGEAARYRFEAERGLFRERVAEAFADLRDPCSSAKQPTPRDRFRGLDDEYRFNSLLRLRVRRYRPSAIANVSIKGIGKLRFALHSLADRWISNSIAAGTLFEPHVLNFLRTAVRPGDTFLDIGGNIGWFTVIGSRLVGADGKVLTFEPDPFNLRLLRQNLALNDCSNVVVCPFALGAKEDTVTLYRSIDNQGDHHLAAVAEQTERISVTQRALDDVMTNHPGRISVIKIDCQGAEVTILRGMRALLRTRPLPRMVIEFWPYGLQRCGVTVEDLAAELTPLGARLWLLYYDGTTEATTPEDLIQRAATYYATDPDRQADLAILSPDDAVMVAAMEAAQLRGPRGWRWITAVKSAMASSYWPF